MMYDMTCRKGGKRRGWLWCFGRSWGGGCCAGPAVGYDGLYLPIDQRLERVAKWKVGEGGVERRIGK